MSDRLRALPSVDRLAIAVARAELAERRAELLAGADDDPDLVARARARLRPSLRRVLNATGVVVHTNLGRAPLAAAARAAVARVAEGYANLELDLERGERASRHDHVGGAAARAHRRRGGRRGQQLRRRRAAGRGGAGGPRARGGRLPRAADRDRRRLPDARRDRAGRGAAGRGRHDEPHAARRLRGGDRAGRRAPSCARTRRTSARSASRRRSRSRRCARSAPPVIDDVGSGVLGDELELLAGEPPVRRSRARRARRSSRSRATSCSAARRPGSSSGRAPRSRPAARIRSRARCASTSCRSRRSRRRWRCTATRRSPGASSRSWRCSPRSRTSCARGRSGSRRRRAARSSRRPGASAAVRCRCSSCAARRSRSTPARAAPTRWPRALRRGDPAVIGRIERGRVLLDPRTLTPAEVDDVAAAVATARG